MAEDQYPVLSVRAASPSPADVTISLDGHVLHSVVSLKFELSHDRLTLATLVLEVAPDVELPAEVLRATRPIDDGDVVRVYPDAGGSWRWHRVAPNGAVISGSQESFSSKQHAVRAAARVNAGVELEVAE